MTAILTSDNVMFLLLGTAAILIILVIINNFPANENLQIEEPPAIIFFWHCGESVEGYHDTFSKLCPENTTYTSVPCDCAINTTQPCLLECFKCIK